MATLSLSDLGVHDAPTMSLSGLAALPAVERQSLLQKLGQTWPAQMVKSAYDAVRLPGQVAGGIMGVEPAQPGMWSDMDEARQQANQSTMMNRAADLGGLVMGGSYAAAPAMKNATGMGIRAYHGSPHDFDRFDLSKIGTGEGAQVYGHGLYFAEKEGIAKHYRDTLTADRTQPAQRLLNKFGGDADAAMAAARAEIERLQNLKLTPETGLDRARSMIETQENNIAMLNQLKASGSMSPGRMYEVNINARPEQFLDWDKPLREQTGVLEKAVASLGGEGPVRDAWRSWDNLNTNMIGPDGRVIDYNAANPLWAQYDKLSAPGLDRAKIRTGRLLDALDREVANPEKYPAHRSMTQKGEDLYRSISQASKDNSAGSELLRDLGVPGIKYLDQGSRGAGEGSRNYVVFDDKLIEIVRKYGIAGAASLYGVSESDIAQAAQGAPQ